jgi:predicted ester cyclase
VVTPDVVDHNAVIFMQPEGPGGVEDGIRMLLQGFPDLRVTTQELLAEGDQVVARFTLSGTNTGDYRGLPAPIQQHFESEAIAILRIADGRVTEFQGTADRLSMLTQLGILAVEPTTGSGSSWSWSSSPSPNAGSVPAPRPRPR